MALSLVMFMFFTDGRQTIALHSLQCTWIHLGYCTEAPSENRKDLVEKTREVDSYDGEDLPD